MIITLLPPEGSLVFVPAFVLLVVEVADGLANLLLCPVSWTVHRISNHLACLRWCGYVESRREGKVVYYRVADPRVRDLLDLAHTIIADNAAAILSCTRI